ncbi:MAG: enoyl-CoA hydratase [Isosphaeraceae bacterium]|jgi:methylglutaconyl-CoA hydratase|nr:MAG: enoyl-CoA hydratase [Isosphaeraceae bacterium]
MVTSQPRTPEDSLVLRDDRGPVAVLTLNRPEKRNALSRALIARLSDALSQVAAQRSVRVVVITGAGKTFCAGMDLAEAVEAVPADEAEASRRIVQDMNAFADLIDQIHRLPKPVVAAVHGDALAGGAGLAIACDFVVMDETAGLSYPEVRRGLVAAVVMHDLVRQIGERRARQLLLTGDRLDARTALAWGLVNETTAAFACLESAVALATALARGAPQALATTKSLLDEATARPGDLRAAAAVSALVRDSEEAREGIRAFLEKREPRW